MKTTSGIPRGFFPVVSKAVSISFLGGEAFTISDILRIRDIPSVPAGLLEEYIVQEHGK